MRTCSSTNLRQRSANRGTRQLRHDVEERLEPVHGTVAKGNTDGNRGVEMTAATTQQF
jgi:hypothetical protein